MGQVAAVSKIHAEDRITGLEHRKKDAHVGLGSGVGLHVGVVCPEELLCTISGQVLRHVDEFAAAIVALGWVALGVLVGQHRAGGFQYRARGVVLACDQLEIVALTAGFELHGLPELGIIVLDEGHWRSFLCPARRRDLKYKPGMRSWGRDDRRGRCQTQTIGPGHRPGCAGTLPKL